MTLLTRHLMLLVSGWFATTAVAGEITLFEHADFGGRRVTLRGTIPNFDPSGFNDRAASMVIRDGFWEVCTDAFFRGRCATFGPGEYRSLQPSLTDTISSAREVSGPPPGPSPGPPIVIGGGAPRIELWERREFGGHSITLTTGAPDFERIGFNDRADAAVVLCRRLALVRARGSGRSMSGGPGRCNDLGYLGGRVSSVAIVGGGGGGGGWVPPGRPRAILYEYGNFGGRTLVVEGNVVPDLDRTGFNDRASSIRIEGGYWMFCTDAGFQGTCRTFGPGEYPSLPWDVDNRISSGRRISEHYPYNSPPAWGSPH
jgi:hypothetical protein